MRTDERPEPPHEWTKTVTLYFVGYDEITALQGPAYAHESTAERIAHKQEGAVIYWCDVTMTSNQLEKRMDAQDEQDEDFSPPPGYTGPWAG